MTGSRHAGSAILVGEAHARGGLVAARSLARAGWDVGWASPDEGGLADATNAVAHRHRIPADPDRVADLLPALLAAGGYDVVFGLGDQWVLALAATGDPHVAHRPGVARLFDKLELADLAQRHALDPPRTAAATDDVLAGWLGRCVVKARVHVARAAAGRAEARVFASGPDAIEHCAELRALGVEPVVQEVLDGALAALTVLRVAGTDVARVQQVADRTWPQPAGISARAHTVAVDRVLCERVDALVDDVAADGLVQVQFLVGPDGRARCIDANPRFYGSLALAVAAGADLPVLWARALVGSGAVPGEAGHAVEARPGVGYQWLFGDLRAAAAGPRRWAELAAAARLARSAAHAVYDGRDRGPARTEAAALMRRLKARLRSQ
jgi:predicted ATP-grasp superfamily ATP-dependent carboligase